jgi:hypothetical protein
MVGEVFFEGTPLLGVLMLRTNLGPLILAVGVFVSPVLGQQAPVQNPSDLGVEFRSATGSNRFRIGEVIPLEVSFSARRLVVTWNPVRCSMRAGSLGVVS